MSQPEAIALPTERGTNKTERIYYMDVLRILSVFAVIVMHICAPSWPKVSIDSSAWYVMTAAESLVRWCVPVLVMISGALFLDPGKSFRFKRLITKNTLRIGTAFVFWSAVYAALNALKGVSLIYVLGAFISGNDHMWFLFMIVGLYIVTPLFRKITEDKKLTEYFLLIAFLFTVLIPILFTFAYLMFPSGAVNYFISILSDDITMLCIKLTGGFTIYYVAGHYIAHYDISKNVRKLLYVLGLLGIAATFLLTVWLSRKTSTANDIFFSNFALPVTLTSIGIFVFGKYELSKINFKRLGRTLLLKLSRYSFGTYLVHVLVIDRLNAWAHFNIMTIHPMVSVILLPCLVFLISNVITALLSKIPVLNKYII